MLFLTLTFILPISLSYLLSMMVYCSIKPQQIVLVCIILRSYNARSPSCVYVSCSRACLCVCVRVRAYVCVLACVRACADKYMYVLILHFSTFCCCNLMLSLFMSPFSFVLPLQRHMLHSGIVVSLENAACGYVSVVLDGGVIRTCMLNSGQSQVIDNPALVSAPL